MVTADRLYAYHACQWRKNAHMFKSLMFISLTCSLAHGVESTAKTTSIADIPFAEVNGRTLRVNLAIPNNVPNPPLVVCIFGGGWRSGDRNKAPGQWLTQRGFAVAAPDYRLSQEAVFPAQIHDCKGAVRWLRANAMKYGYDANKIGVVGASAGAHLAVLLGTSGGIEALEGSIGGNPNLSSKVDAIVDFYGPTNFILRAKDQPEQTEMPNGKVFQLLGGTVRSRMQLAREASGITYVGKDDPPLLIFHGTKDDTVLMNQSKDLEEAYRKHSLPVELHAVEGAGHGGDGFMTAEIQDRVAQFLNKALN